MDIVLKRDLERDINAAFLLKMLEVCNPLTGRLDLDGKSVHGCYDIKRVVHDMIVGESQIVFPNCCGSLNCGDTSDDIHYINYCKVENMG